MENLRRVHPANPPAPYIGGKKQLAGHIASLIASIPHQTYAEPFVGMGGVFLRREVAARSEIINDRSRDVATLFRVLQRHYAAFMDMLKFQLTTRADFARLMEVNPDTLTDLERAARFLYLQRLAFGGKVMGRNFGMVYGDPARFDVIKLGGLLADLSERLAPVVIENLPFDEFIARYDGPDVLFYLDPPYWGNEGDYGKDAFSRDGFARLAVQLAGIKGKFILSLKDVPGVRECFSAFEFETRDLTYTIGHHAPKAVTEVIITPLGQKRIAAQPSLALE